MLAHPRLAEMQYFKYNPHGGLEATTSSNVDISRKCAHDKTSTGNALRIREQKAPRADHAPFRRRERNGIPRRFRARQRHERPAADAAVETRTKPCEREGFQHKGGAVLASYASSALEEQACPSAEERSANIFGDVRPGCVRRDARSTTGAHAAACCASKTMP